MKKLLTILFAISALIFVACEDKDDKDATNEDKTPAVEVCDPACNADAETCVCKDTDAGDHVCACEAKATEECKCNDGSACPEGGKDACPKHEDAKCDPACAEDKECKCEADKCECVDKAHAPKCEPACNPDTEDCLCEADKCECKPRNVEECKCDDGSACPGNDKAKCAAAPVEDKCVGKAENDECDANKTCQKGEGDKLECKDKPADPAPSEPTQPSKPE